MADLHLRAFDATGLSSETLLHLGTAVEANVGSSGTVQTSPTAAVGSSGTVRAATALNLRVESGALTVRFTVYVPLLPEMVQVYSSGTVQATRTTVVASSGSIVFAGSVLVDSSGTVSVGSTPPPTPVTPPPFTRVHQIGRRRWRYP